MKRDIKVFIDDVIKAVENILEFTKNLTYKEFCGNKLVTSAVIRQFEIIGEAVKQIPEDIYLSNPDIPWNDMARMRDRLIHGYFDISYQIIWRTVKEKLPELSEKLKNIKL